MGIDWRQDLSTRHETNNERVHCTSTRCGRYKQSSQWKPNTNWTIDELSCSWMNWTECRVHSTAAHAISIEIAQTPLPHTPSTHTEFIKVSCGAIITFPLLENPSIYSGTCAWFTITFTMVIVTLLSTDSPRCHVYNACNASQGRSCFWGRHGSHKLRPK